MRILFLSWEYPPVSHGGLARHVDDLSQALARKGHSIHIVTSGGDGLDSYSQKNGVDIHRSSPVKIEGNNFIDKINHLNFQLAARAVEVIQQYGGFDLIHGHDWLVFWASKILKHGFRIPLVHTIHATEYGRNHGIHNDLQRYINDVEWYTCYEAWKLIVCSDYMKEEIKRLFQLPEDKVKIINNGVEPDNFNTEVEDEFREKYAHPDEKIIFYVGRLVREKGIQYLIRALSIILHDQPQIKLVIAGKGPYEGELKRKAEELGIADRVYFTGFISDEERNKLYRTADLAVFPSLYEPFGIVALEAMAAQIPLITTNAGGLDEFIVDGRNALKVNTGDPFQLAGSILRILNDPKRSEEMVERAYREVVSVYNWDIIAEKTYQLYRKVLNEYYQSGWNIYKEKRKRRKYVY